MNNVSGATPDEERRRSFGLALIVTGWLLRVACLAMIPYVVEGDWSLLVFVPPLVLSAGFIRWGRMRRAPRAEKVLVEDARAPILFLRSFRDEDDDKGVTGVSRSLKSADRSLAPSTPAWGPREQEALASIFRKIGPYVAIGKPREKLPEVGAARMYVGDDDWQTRVTELSTRARLVIVRAGSTNGLQWEVERLVALVPPTKVLVLLPADADQYLRFCEWANKALPVPLAREMPDGRFLVFDEHWTPRVLPVKPTLTKSLEPYFQQNGVALKENVWEAFLEQNGLRS